MLVSLLIKQLYTTNLANSKLSKKCCHRLNFLAYLYMRHGSHCMAGFCFCHMKSQFCHLTMKCIYIYSI